MHVEIPSGPGTLDAIQAALDTFWSRHEQVPEQVRREVGIAVDEIAANIVEHGSAGSMRMDIQFIPNEIRVEFTDSGEPAAVDLGAAQMPDALADGGRGLALAQATLRLLSYFRDEIGNHWRLVSKPFVGVSSAATRSSAPVARA